MRREIGWRTDDGHAQIAADPHRYHILGNLLAEAHARVEAVADDVGQVAVHRDLHLAVVFEEFERVIAAGGAGLIISSMAGHMMRQLPEHQEQALAHLPADELLALPFLKEVPNSLVGYMIAKRANHLRVQSAAMTWGARGARVNSISPGIVVTPLAQHELSSELGDGYRAMIAVSPLKRMAPPEEIAVAAAYLLGPDAGFITGSDLLIDGGVIAAMRAGQLPVPA